MAVQATGTVCSGVLLVCLGLRALHALRALLSERAHRVREALPELCPADSVTTPGIGPFGAEVRHECELRSTWLLNSEIHKVN